MGALTQIYLFLTPTGEFQVTTEFNFANSPLLWFIFILPYWIFVFVLLWPMS